MTEFPTDFAVLFAKQCGLIDKDASLTGYGIEMGFKSPKTAEQKAEEEYQLQQYDKLIQFQQIASISDYDTAMVVYTGQDLDEEHKAALEIIAQLTPAWVKGRVADMLLTKLGDDTKSMAAIADVLIKAMDTGEISVKGAAGAQVKSFYMELTGSND